MTKLFYKDSELLLKRVKRYIKKTNIVLDIGCGICPQNYFRPKAHIMLEPFKEYVDILKYKYQDVDNVCIIQGMADEILPKFADNSVGSVFLLDVIEHLEKEDGFKLLKEVLRIAKKQIILFTPLGFMPQDYENHEKDAWGLSGIELQKHKSGWEPEDLKDLNGNWNFLVCPEYHQYNSRGDKLEKPFGAFFAVNNLNIGSKIFYPEKLSKFESLNQKILKKGEKFKNRLKKVFSYYVLGLLKKFLLWIIL